MHSSHLQSRIMYELFILLPLNRNPFIYPHMKMYPETNTLHFICPNKSDVQLYLQQQVFLKNTEVTKSLMKTQVEDVTEEHCLLTHHLPC